MEELRKSARKVIDEILDNGIYKQNTEDYPNRITDTCILLKECSKILKGTYRKSEIDEHINDCCTHKNEN